jgi:hypothetical protein
MIQISSPKYPLTAVAVLGDAEPHVAEAMEGYAPKSYSWNNSVSEIQSPVWNPRAIKKNGGERRLPLSTKNVDSEDDYPIGVQVALPETQMTEVGVVPFVVCQITPVWLVKNFR